MLPHFVPYYHNFLQNQRNGYRPYIRGHYRSDNNINRWNTGPRNSANNSRREQSRRRNNYFNQNKFRPFRKEDRNHYEFPKQPIFFMREPPMIDPMQQNVPFHPYSYSEAVKQQAQASTSGQNQNASVSKN